MVTRGWRQSVRREVRAFVSAAAATPWSLGLRDEVLDPTAPHPTPVVLIHGLFGNASNFLPLRRVLVRRGVSNVHSFSYLPGLDVARVAHRLKGTIEGICAATGSAHVDVVGHSLGGLVARYLTALPAGRLIRRLITLGAPHFSPTLASQELAIYAAHDALIAPPRAEHGALAGHLRIVPDCGHLSLLYHPAVLRDVARHLARPARPTVGRGNGIRPRRAGAQAGRAQLGIV